MSNFFPFTSSNHFNRLNLFNVDTSFLITMFNRLKNISKTSLNNWKKNLSLILQILFPIIIRSILTTNSSFPTINQYWQKIRSFIKIESRFIPTIRLMMFVLLTLILSQVFLFTLMISGTWIIYYCFAQSSELTIDMDSIEIVEKGSSSSSYRNAL